MFLNVDQDHWGSGFGKNEGFMGILSMTSVASHVPDGVIVAEIKG